MFNLDQAISEWRKKLAAQGVKSRKVLDELESHLREDVEEQIRSGLDESEAFRAAVQRIGEGHALKVEFAKLHHVGQTRLSRLFQTACFVSAAFILITSAWVIVDLDESVVAKLFSLSFISCLACYAASLPLWYRSLPNPYRKGIQILMKAMSLSAGLFIVLALLDAFGLVHLHIGASVTMLVWSLLAAHLLTILAYLCLDIERGFGWGLFDCPPAEKFSELAQRALELGHEEAAHLRHDFIGTEHLLLGILGSQSGLLEDLFRKWDVDGDAIRADIERVVTPGTARKSARDLPYTPRSKRALTIATREAAVMDHSVAAPEHVLLGLLIEPEGVAGRVLRNLGLNAERARRDILDAMGPGGTDGPQPVIA